jgi:hypothetical protein
MHPGKALSASSSLPSSPSSCWFTSKSGATQLKCSRSWLSRAATFSALSSLVRATTKTLLLNCSQTITVPQTNPASHLPRVQQFFHHCTNLPAFWDVCGEIMTHLHVFTMHNTCSALPCLLEFGLKTKRKAYGNQTYQSLNVPITQAVLYRLLATGLQHERVSMLHWIERLHATCMQDHTIAQDNLRRMDIAVRISHHSVCSFSFGWYTST